MTEVIEIQKIREEMDSNGYASFDREAFDRNLSRPCYVPEGAEELSDVFNRKDLEGEVENFLNNNRDYLDRHKGYEESHEEFVNSMVVQLYEELEWQFPSTILEDWNMLQDDWD